MLIRIIVFSSVIGLPLLISPARCTHLQSGGLQRLPVSPVRIRQGLHPYFPPEIGGRKEIYHIEGFQGICLLAEVWFQGNTRHPTASTPGPSRVPPHHEVYHRHCTVDYLDMPVRLRGTACRTEFRHLEDSAPSLVNYCNTCIACLLWMKVVS